MIRRLSIRRSLDAAGQGWPRVTIVDLLLTVLMSGIVAIVVIFGARILEMLHLVATPQPTMTEAPEQPLPISALLAEPVAIFLAIFLMVVLRGRATWKELGFRAVPLRWIAIAFVAAILCLMTSGFIGRLIEPYYKTSLVEQYTDLLAPIAGTPAGAALLFAMVGLVIPAAEEALFRGLLYGWLRARWGPAISIAISALAFAAAHRSLQVALQIFIIGLVLGWLYERSRSLLASIVAHGTVNTLSLVVVLYYAGSYPSGAG